ncbi:gamma-glutamyl-gamma-aminobutyrate hydrolase family protein [uncultured Parolsenella sp.]|uniref:gamma-glutamyl-gamma-aminobutyrate hydrolase family protein n=1 Tax=uncultured Parolsenella sp. TaxID=2083008 RepID=UPI0025D8C800|nr:gamma-glutamyl-gamma-aminobutyrate hydrolase family protein [uncultured Parolsenella sp.]
MSHSTAAPHRPLIGVSPRLRVHPRSIEVPEQLAPEWAIASVFDQAIIAAGGIPVTMPLTDDESVIDEMVERFDGFAIPGGKDVDPALWGVEGYDEGLLCHERDAFELALIKRVLAADKPLFGTCRGAQMMNVAMGGTLCMDVPSLGACEGMVQWRHTGIITRPGHPVDVEPGTLLSKCVGGRTQIQVNTSHHCCVDKLGEGVRLVAHATDGVPEAIEVPGKRFVLGVQWHPEYTWSYLDSDMGLWREFVAAC